MGVLFILVRMCFFVIGDCYGGKVYGYYWKNFSVGFGYRIINLGYGGGGLCGDGGLLVGLIY